MKKETKAKLRPIYMVYPGLYPLLMLNYWVRKSDIPITGIMISAFDTKVKGRILPFHEEIVRFVKRSGWRYSIYMLLVAKLAAPIVYTWGVMKRLLRKKTRIKTFAQIAQEKGIPIYRSKDFNGDEALNFLKNVNANLIVSAYNNQILKSRVINYPQYKTINIHPGYLPDFRGLDAVFEAMYHKVPKAGVTIHYVDTKIDTGKIIAQGLLKVRKTDTLFSLNVRMWMHGAKMLHRVLDMIQKDTVVSRKQNVNKVKYPYKSYPEKERIAEFIKAGRRIITWRNIANTFK